MPGDISVLEQTVVLVWRRADVRGNQNRNDQRVDCDDTRHDDWNKGLTFEQVSQVHISATRKNFAHLHDKIWSEGTDTGDSNTRLRCSVCCTDTCPRLALLRQLDVDGPTSEGHREADARLPKLSAPVLISTTYQAWQLTIPKNGANLGARSLSAMMTPAQYLILEAD